MKDVESSTAIVESERSGRRYDEERRVLNLARLESLMWELDWIIADPVGFERIQLDVMKVLIQG